MASLVYVDHGPLGTEYPALKAACEARGIELPHIHTACLPLAATSNLINAASDERRRKIAVLQGKPFEFKARSNVMKDGMQAFSTALVGGALASVTNIHF